KWTCTLRSRTTWARPGGQPARSASKVIAHISFGTVAGLSFLPIEFPPLRCTGRMTKAKPGTGRYRLIQWEELIPAWLSYRIVWCNASITRKERDRALGACDCE